MADGTTAPKGALITGLVLLLLAFGGCGYGCVSGVGLFSDVADAISSANTTPLNQPTTLRATGDNGLILTSSSSALCAVRDPNGNDVSIQEPGAGTTGTLEVDGQQLDLSFVFDTTPGTTYDVICGDEAGTSTGEYAVAPIPSLGAVGGLFAGIAGGFGLFILGAIFLIVGLVKRSKWKKNHTGSPGNGMGGPAGYAAPPAPGAVMPPPPGSVSPGAAPPPPMPPAPTAPQPPAGPPPMPGAAPPMPGAAPQMPSQPPPLASDGDQTVQRPAPPPPPGSPG